TPSLPARPGRPPRPRAPPPCAPRPPPPSLPPRPFLPPPRLLPRRRLLPCRHSLPRRDNAGVLIGQDHGDVTVFLPLDDVRGRAIRGRHSNHYANPVRADDKLVTHMSPHGYPLVDVWPVPNVTARASGLAQELGHGAAP